VDTIGIGNHLAGSLTVDYGQRVIYTNVGVPSRFPARVANLKAELYWALRERFQEGDIGCELDPLTQAQLASIKYHHSLRGLIEIESQEDARRRGVRSPDRAESLMLCFAQSRRVWRRGPRTMSSCGDEPGGAGEPAVHAAAVPGLYRAGPLGIGPDRAANVARGQDVGPASPSPHAVHWP
jgi:hypothetical protein